MWFINLMTIFHKQKHILFFFSTPHQLDCDVNCHKKCQKLTANLCGVNQKLIVEALTSVRRGTIGVYISNTVGCRKKNWINFYISRCEGTIKHASCANSQPQVYIKIFWIFNW